MSLLHSSSGLPWVLTLPLAAIIIRTAFVLPLDLWARKHRNKMAEVRPLIQAWSPIIQGKVQKDNFNLPVPAQRKLFLTEMRYKQRELRRLFGVKIYPAFVPLLQLPVWLIAIEAIRKMCGARVGLLGLFSKSVKESEPANEVVIPATAAEPSLAVEGALWFPDLLVPDPQLILPFALSATLFANVTLNQRQQKAEGIPQTKWTNRLTRAVQVLSLAIGPMALAMPSAMLVYWISSSTCAIIQHSLMWNLLPRPPSNTLPRTPDFNSSDAGAKM